MRRPDVLAVLLVVALVAGCDYLDRRDLNRERADRTYRTAMEDYRAGRLPEAVEKLQEVCRADPANASARFQLACLLQDSVKDYFGAACAYREYLAQRADSDKAKIARERFADCERELAKVLSSKYGLNAAGVQEKQNEVLREELKTSATRQAKLQKALSAAMQRVSHLAQETERLKRLMKGGVGEAPPAEAVRTTAVFSNALDVATATADEPSAPAADLSEALSILQEESAEAAAPRPKDDTASVTALLDDETSSGTDLIKRSPGARERRDAAKAAADEAARKKEAAAAAARAKIPDTYVVQEGDTLYKLAERFYGTSKAWSRIREANKTAISTDGRVKVGQRLVLPK